VTTHAEPGMVVDLPARSAVAGADIGPPRLPLDIATRPSRVPTFVRRCVGPLLLLVVWELATRHGIINRTILAPPSTVPGTAWDLWSDGSLPRNLLASVRRAMTGLAIGTTLGVVAATVAGLWRFGEDTIDTTLQLLRPMPALALMPLLVMWFGLGETPKLVIIAYATFFPVYLNVFQGYRNVDMKLVESAAAFGLDRKRLVASVLLPSAASSFFVGFRFSLSVSWLVLVFTEQLNARDGLGYLMIQAQLYFRNQIIVLVLVIYAVLGLVSDQVVKAIERKVLSWRRTYQGS
jgi:sulfonate transport system permease protein